MRTPDHQSSLDARMIAVLREKTPTERLAIADDMWSHARQQIIAVLRFEHPDWSELQIQRETARRLSHGAV